MIGTILTLALAAVPTSSTAAAGLPVGPSANAVAPAVASAETAPPSKMLLDRFSGTIVNFSTAANLQSFAPKLQLTHNPAVTTSLRVLPRFDLGAGFAANANVGFSYEWTNSDFTRTEHEPLLTDTTLGVTYLGLPALPWGTQVMFDAGLTLPTSKISQARTMVVTPNLSVQAFHGFADVLGGRVTLFGSVDYSHSFYRFTTPGLDVEREYAPQCFAGETGCVAQASGLANASDILSWSLFASGRWWIFSPAISFTMSHQFPFGFDDLGGVDRVFDPTTVRVTTSFAAWLDVEIVKGASARVGYALTRNALDGDGQIGNPLFARYQDARLFLTLRVLPFDMWSSDGSRPNGVVPGT